MKKPLTIIIVLLILGGIGYAIYRQRKAKQASAGAGGSITAQPPIRRDQASAAK